MEAIKKLWQSDGFWFSVKTIAIFAAIGAVCFGAFKWQSNKAPVSEARRILAEQGEATPEVVTPYSEADVYELASKIGDSYAEVNALVTTLAFAGAVTAIILQSWELNNQRREMKDTQKIMEQQKVEMVGQRVETQRLVESMFLAGIAQAEAAMTTAGPEGQQRLSRVINQSTSRIQKIMGVPEVVVSLLDHLHELSSEMLTQWRTEGFRQAQRFEGRIQYIDAGFERLTNEWLVNQYEIETIRKLSDRAVGFMYHNKMDFDDPKWRSDFGVMVAGLLDIIEGLLRRLDDKPKDVMLLVEKVRIVLVEIDETSRPDAAPLSE